MPIIFILFPVFLTPENFLHAEETKDAGFYSSANGVFDNSTKNNQNGRDYKANDAAKQANAGMGAAIAAGSSLTASGVPKLGSIFTLPEGIRLLGLAALEFAQAAANAKNKSQNSGQKDRLNSDYSQSNQQLKMNDYKSDLLNQIQTPEFNAAMEKMGVNGESFANQLVSGEFKNSNDIVSALGVDTSNFSDADKEKMSNLTLTESESTLLVGMKDTNDFQNNSTTNGSETPNNSQSNLVSNQNNKLENSNKIEAQDKKENSQSARTIASLENSQNLTTINDKVASDTNTALNIQQIQSLLIDKLNDPAQKEILKTVVAKDWLAGKGIIYQTGKPNIFQLAYGNYKSFKKWRVTKNKK